MERNDQQKTITLVRDSRGRYVRGVSGNIAGRPRGCLNKATQFAQLKDHVLLIYEALGGLDNFLKWAKRNEDSFFLALLKAVLRSAQIDLQSTTPAESYESIIQELTMREHITQERQGLGTGDGDDVNEVGEYERKIQGAWAEEHDERG